VRSPIARHDFLGADIREKANDQDSGTSHWPGGRGTPEPHRDQEFGDKGKLGGPPETAYVRLGAQQRQSCRIRRLTKVAIPFSYSRIMNWFPTRYIGRLKRRHYRQFSPNIFPILSAAMNPGAVRSARRPMRLKKQENLG
jgi:hypothetical protein